MLFSRSMSNPQISTSRPSSASSSAENRLQRNASMVSAPSPRDETVNLQAIRTMTPETIDDAPPPVPEKEVMCNSCNRRVVGSMISALGGSFHVECFKCMVQFFVF